MKKAAYRLFSHVTFGETRSNMKMHYRQLDKAARQAIALDNIHKSETVGISNMFLHQKMSDIVNKLSDMNAELNTRLNLLQDRIAQAESKLANTVIATTAMSMDKSFIDVRCDFLKTYPRATGFLADVQYCNLHILKFLKKLTDENGLSFWLHAGTLIGALRHQGFVPWDDDVDVGMMRADFDALVNIVASRDDCRIYRYYNDITCSVSYQFKMNDIPVFIDIAVFDWTVAPKQEDRTNFLEKFRNARRSLVGDFRQKLKSPAVENIGYNHCGPYSPLIQKKVDALIQKYANAVQARQDHGDAIYLGMENYPFPYPVMAVDQMFPLQNILFEGCSFQAPVNAELYLSGYGDIWACPADIGKTPHLYAFEPFRKEIKQFIGKEKIND
ncbi:MAG: LicD family protein [Alphaproteobacteria bacterium]|nr:LicD family protein [Alphaproteobacteria bacterium]